MSKVIPTEGILHTVLSSERMGWKEKGLVATSLIARPFEGRKKGLVPITRTCTNYPKKTWGATKDCMPFHPPPVGNGTRQCHIWCSLVYSRLQEEGKKCTVVCSIPGFLGVD